MEFKFRLIAWYRSATTRQGRGYEPALAEVPPWRPLQSIRVIVNEALRELSPTFARLYAPVGRRRCSASSATR
jgi:hypothetical protein